MEIETRVMDWREFDNDNEIEIMDCREGCLLDSYIGYNNEGKLVAVFETYVNPWQSCYTVVMGDEADIWDRWNTFTEQYDEEYPEEE